MLIARDRADEAGQGIGIAYVIPKEGAVMWFDNLAIPSDAPHPSNAHMFVNYIMEPEAVAAISNYVFYANGNSASLPYVDDEVKTEVQDALDFADKAQDPPLEHLYTDVCVECD